MISCRMVAFSLLLSSVAAQAQIPGTPSDEGVLASASADRSVVVGGKAVKYRVNWSELPLRDAQGQPQATISMTSYTRQGVADATSRPVIFAFNGGPGASSSALHFGLLGPRIRTGEKNGQAVISDNPQTLLDFADLVMIDPVGTGFSRELRPGGGSPYWSVKGDAQSVESAMRAWLADHRRLNSPIFVVGESYGGFRAAVMAETIGDLNVAGFVLISPGLDISSQPDQDAIFNLPSMAAAAFAHNRIAPAGRSVAEVFEEARAFAQGEYAAALQLGSALPATDRDRLAQRMSAMIGLPASTIAAANLRVDSQDFLEQLLPGMVVGRVDTRVAAPAPKEALVPGRIKAADDPALNMGASNIKKTPAARDYLKAVGVKTERDYIGLTLDVNFQWNFNSGSPKYEDNLRINPTPNFGLLMKSRPDTRILLISSYYDLATPLLSSRYSLEHAGIKNDRVKEVIFPSGHTTYGDAESRSRLSDVLRDFIVHQPAK